ncbi:hypothetical protein EG329_003077 [Mollisiaceae sp. DMI_Dod_QoI]|nr:hypothetical protein EG329_003077 [Helotiales sp. DMI_Dod_QoI]
MLALTSLLFFSTVSAGVLNAVHMVRRSDSMEENMRRFVDRIVEPMERRQMATPSTGINVTEWDAQTQAACTTSLEALNGVASNPSGMAVCYNLPYLDNSTGVFEADLRLFMIAAPTGTFTNIASSNVQVGLVYNGATVSAVNSSSLKRRSDVSGTSLISWPRGIDKRAAPTLVQSYAFVGQVNKDLLTANMGTAALQKVLVPVVTLTGTDGTGASVNTSLSSDEATFVSGVFAAQVTPTKSQVSPPIQTLVVASDAPFVVPGLNILIVPIGLIITSIWTVLFVGTIAYGTVGRMQFREHYRRRAARAEKGDLARI